MFICKQSSRNQKFSKCGPHTSSFSITWELTENANSQTPTQTYYITNPREKTKPSVFHKSSGESDAHSNVRITGVEQWFSAGGEFVFQDI